MRRVTTAEIIFALYLLGVFLLQEIDKSKYHLASIFWTAQTVVLTVLLCVTLKRLRQLQKQVSFIFCNERLTCAHQILFIVATAINANQNIMDYISEDIAPNDAA